MLCVLYFICIVLGIY